MKNKVRINLPDYIKNAFGDTLEKVLEKKQTEKQERLLNMEAPQVVKLEVSECKDLCSKAGVTYKDGYEERILRYTCSDESVDRMGDIIKQDGWQLENYNKNPVIMGYHDYSKPPVGNSLKTWVEDGKLKMWVLFADEETSKEADGAFRLAKAGFMKAGSVGFMPKGVKHPSDEERKELGMGPWGVIFETNDLLEFSVCGVPANANALQESINKGLCKKKDFASWVGKEVYSSLKEPDNTNSANENKEKTETGKEVVANFSIDEGLIAKLVNGKVKEYIDSLQEKQGAVLSKKNIERIDQAVKSMKTATEALEQLLEDAKPDEDNSNPESQELEINLDDFEDSEEEEGFYSEENVIEIDVD